jgi:hypothetical protein
MMIVGSSVPQMFAQWNLLQILLHFMGCIFTVWFVLDSWPASDILQLWIFFCLLPFLCEIAIIVHAFKFNKDVFRNTSGIKR